MRKKRQFSHTEKAFVEAEKTKYGGNPRIPVNYYDQSKVFVNGCFDVLHIGHIRLFKYAKSFAPHLVVGIDSDSRVKKLKGESRPINTEEDRKEMLLSLKYVDTVVVFDNDDELEELVYQCNPETMVVGEEYKNKKVIGSEHTKELKFFKKVNGYSTTSTLQNLTDR